MTVYTIHKEVHLRSDSQILDARDPRLNSHFRYFPFEKLDPNQFEANVHLI